MSICLQRHNSPQGRYRAAQEAKAASESNMALAERRRRRRENSLLTLGADGSLYYARGSRIYRYRFPAG